MSDGLRLATEVAAMSRALSAALARPALDLADVERQVAAIHAKWAEIEASLRADAGIPDVADARSDA